jgi:hypothetical protein
MLEKIKASLGERVKDVRVTHTASPIRPPAWWPTSTTWG